MGPTCCSNNSHHRRAISKWKEEDDEFVYFRTQSHWPSLSLPSAQTAQRVCSGEIYFSPQESDKNNETTPTRPSIVKKYFIFFLCLCSYHFFLLTMKVTIFLCCGWIIILLTILPIYVMLMMFNDRLVMSVCWFQRVDIYSELSRSSENSEYYWFEVQILLTTLLTIFLPMSLIFACNVRILTIGERMKMWNR